MLKIADLAFRSDTGRQRNANEDSYFARAPVFLVADGMGGAQAGEVASKTAADAFERDLPDGAPEKILPRDDRVGQPRDPRARPRATPRAPGWGRRSPRRCSTPRPTRWRSATSATAAPTACASGRLELLTSDHSLVEEMRRKGQITDEQAEDHPQRSIITRALGPEAEVDVDVQTVSALPGDVFLLCSDGLTTMIGERRIEAAAARTRPRSTLPSGRWSTTPTARAAATTSPRSHSASTMPPAPAPAAESPTLVGPSAAEEGFTAEEVRRGTAAARARTRGRSRGAGERACGGRRRPRRRLSCSPRSSSAPPTGSARSGSSAPTTAAGWRSTGAFPMTSPSGSASTRSATRARSRPPRCRRASRARSPATTCARARTPPR